jgi:hypothetical protein
MPTDRLAIVVLVAFLVSPTLCQADPLAPSAFPDPLRPAVEDKEQARAEFEASQARLADLRRERLEALTTQFRTRYQQSLVGRGSQLDIPKETARSIRDARLALAATPGQRVAALEWYWLYTRESDTVVSAQYQAGRASPADWANAVAVRLEAEIQLAGALRKQAPPSLPDTPLPSPVLEEWVPLLDPAWDRQVARDYFEAVEADTAKLARARLDATRVQHDTRWQQYLAGRGTLDFLLQSAQRLLEAKQAVSGTAADRQAALQQRWDQARVAEQVVGAQYAAARASPADYAQAQFTRLDAAIALAKAAGRRGQPFAPGADLPQPPGADEDAKSLARAEFEDTNADISGLQRARFDAARTEFLTRYRQYLAGRGTLDILVEIGGNLRDAQLDTLDRPADRIAVLELYASRTRMIESVVRAQYEAGRASLADFAQARSDRLEAEIHLAEARGARAGNGK